MDDTLYPNDGSYFMPQEPEEQVTERRVKVGQAQAAKPMLEELIKEFDVDIARLSSIDSIKVDVNTEPEEFLKCWNIAQELKAYAEEKKNYLESLLVTTKR